ncbi:Period circadian protein [Trichinella spiralis]|uniref:Period circadian protein n=1 Tax=Trichinella spiralis TaxID=6334 RepID=A0ABR3KCX3_TRISP
MRLALIACCSFVFFYAIHLPIENVAVRFCTVQLIGRGGLENSVNGKEALFEASLNTVLFVVHWKRIEK